MFDNKIICKTTRHEANMGKTDGGNWGSVSWVPLPCTRYDVQGMMVFILHGVCHFVTWVIDELILLIYYYTVLLLAWFPLGYTDAFSTSSFQITITIDWYARIGCGMGHSYFHVLGLN